MTKTTRPPKQQTITAPEFLPTESQIAMAFVDYVAITHPHLSEDLIHIPNENRCSWAQGKKLKAEGKRAGVSDYFFARPVIKREYLDEERWQDYLICGLWLELKSKKGKETKEQKEFGARMVKNGFHYKVAHSLDEAIRHFEEYLNGNPTRFSEFKPSVTT